VLFILLAHLLGAWCYHMEFYDLKEVTEGGPSGVLRVCVISRSAEGRGA